MRKKILFIDRDGTIIVEPPVTNQLDAFSKLEFYPNVFEYLSKIIKEMDYDLVMVTNQDGLGTEVFPEEAFWPIQNFVVKTFKDQGIEFSEIYIDKSFAHENKDTRKPGVGMLKKYFDKEKYDLKNSFVIGDRLTDVELARNLGSRAFFINNFQELGTTEITVSKNDLKKIIALETQKWEDIYYFLKQENVKLFSPGDIQQDSRLSQRKISHSRNTNETKIEVEINLDGNGIADMKTGLGFFDHMLEQVAKHSGLDIKIHCNGDLHIDEHHTIEDVALALGEAILLALGDKRGIERYGFLLPMDDCLAQVAIDFGGRNWLVWDTEFKREKIGEMPTEMFYHFFKSFSDASKSNINIKAEGTNEHHKIEAVFKAFARSIKMAVRKDPLSQSLPTTKGVL